MESKVFNDPIHGHMEFHPFLVKIIDTPQFQRLRYIKQLGGAYFVYPGASHNRFEHSLGVAHLAGLLVRNLKEKQADLGIDDRDIICVEIAGLCHDLGHGPFSHLFDGMFLPETQSEARSEARPDTQPDTDPEWKHETGSVVMFNYIVNKLKTQEKFDLVEELKKLTENKEGDDLEFIREMINGPKENEPYKGRPSNKHFLYDIVANKRNGLDVDKFDYFARDSYHLGIKNSFDHIRYITFARVIKVGEEWQICTRDKELDNIYEMFHTRSSLHRKAYQHKTNKIIESMIKDALLMAENHEQISKAIDNMEQYTQLTDGIFEKILYSTGNDLKEAREILQNVLSRKLYTYVGKTKMTDAEIQEGKKKTREKLVKMITGEDRDLKPKDNFGIFITTFDFGNNKENPIDKVYFYNKFDKNKAFKISREKVSQFLLPNKFSEKWINVYCKSSDENILEDVNKLFSEWFSKRNISPDSGTNETRVGLEDNIGPGLDRQQ